MRWIALLLVAGLFPVTSALAQETSVKKKTPKPPTSRPDATAEPDDGAVYAPPSPVSSDVPSEADLGPVLKHFVFANQVDNPNVEIADNVYAEEAHEKMALDKRIKVPLVHDVQNDASYKVAENPALAYEIDYLNWGAVTQSQLQKRKGHYFTITWDNGGPKDDFVACFEYRQLKSKEIVRKLVQPMPKVEGTTRSYFAVVDKAFLAYGPVSSWRFTIRKGDTIVAQSKSFIW